MQRIIFDCDNTMGIQGCDVDDGLALLCLLGRNDVELLGVTTTYGNSTIDTVYCNTLEMFKELGIDNIPLIKGAPSIYSRQSDASKFLAETARKYPGEITLLATGSLTNLYGAYECDSSFFTNLKQIVLMGGITKPLIINGKNLDELNFSCDPEASFAVLSSNVPVTVLTGHICLQAFFGEKEYKRLMDNTTSCVYKYIKDKTINWYSYVMNLFGIKGFYNWDIVTAVYITHPELFDDNICRVISNSKELQRGYLKIDISSSDGYTINAPEKIKDIERFNEVIFESWQNAENRYPYIKGLSYND